MLDYKLVEAMAMVVAEGNFERAARALCITQPAVSQRVRLLEEQVGQVLLARTSPPSPTSAGESLLRHFRQVQSLEDDVFATIAPQATSAFSTLAIGINADSLATWFFPAVSAFVLRNRLTLDLRVDDQESTQNFIKSGEVMGSISSYARTVQGCARHPLGSMTYRLLATPDHARQWFARGVTTGAVSRAPAIIFNRKDNLHHRLLSRHLGRMPGEMPIHYIPTAEQFFSAILGGLGYGVVPDLQGQAMLDAGRLVPLVDTSLEIELYWHVWTHKSRLLDAFTGELVRGASGALNSPSGA